MAIGDTSALSGVIEPAQHGRLSLHFEALEIESPEWVQAIVTTVKAASRPVLVATPSFELALRLGELIPDAYVRQAGESAAAAAARGGEVLIAAGAWAGLDTPTRWRSIVVPRVPYPRLDVIDDVITTSYVDNRNVAIRRLRQVIGRGLRTPDAECAIYLLDGRAAKLSGFVPERFSLDWNGRTYLEGGRRPLVLNAVEQRADIRAAALRHYGMRDPRNLRCMGECGVKPYVSASIHVHHKFPIREGVRRTAMEDVALLCACCHAIVHDEDPPMPLERLIEVNRQRRARGELPAL